MRTWLQQARESFWFLPAVFGAGAIVLAVGLVQCDRLLIGVGMTDLPFVADLSATGGRAILAAIGGTMLAVAATSFSITISVLATTSSAYGPRLVRNFMADRGNQLVLAVLTSTFLYALIVLGSVRTEADSSYAFVPVVAVAFAMVLAVCDVAVLVYFIHHIASSVQVTTLQNRVLTELETVIDLLYPDGSDEEDGRGSAAVEEPDSPPVEYVSEETGPLVQIDLDKLVSVARHHDAVFRVRALPGDYVVAGDPLIQSRVSARARVSSAQAASPASAFAFGTARTPHQDIRFAVQQLTEIGMRGLATGTNDPYTAVSALDALGGALARLCSRGSARSSYRDEDDVVRVICEWPDVDELIADVYLAIRSYALRHPLVMRAAVRLTARLERVAHGAPRRELLTQSEALADAYLETSPFRGDADPLIDGLRTLQRLLSEVGPSREMTTS